MMSGGGGGVAKRTTKRRGQRVNNQFKGHFLHMYVGSGEPLEDGEVNEMTLPYTCRMQNSSLGGICICMLRGSTIRTIVLSRHERYRATL